MRVPALVAAPRVIVMLALASAVGVPGAEAAQDASAVAPKRVTEIVFLGTAGGAPLRLDRENAGPLATRGAGR